MEGENEVEPDLVAVDRATMVATAVEETITVAIIMEEAVITDHPSAMQVATRTEIAMEATTVGMKEEATIVVIMQNLAMEIVTEDATMKVSVPTMVIAKMTEEEAVTMAMDAADGTVIGMKDPTAIFKVATEAVEEIVEVAMEEAETVEDVEGEDVEVKDALLI
jgi:hypothetical protein